MKSYDWDGRRTGPDPRAVKTAGYSIALKRPYVDEVGRSKLAVSVGAGILTLGMLAAIFLFLLHAGI